MNGGGSSLPSIAAVFDRRFGMDLPWPEKRCFSTLNRELGMQIHFSRYVGDVIRLGAKRLCSKFSRRW